MPYAWSRDINDLDRITRSMRHRAGEDPTLGLKIEAHNSLTPEGFVSFISATGFLMLIPVLALLGTGPLWLVLGFMGLALSAMWIALKRSWRAGGIVEIFELWPDRVRLTRFEPGGRSHTFETNPYWVRVECHQNDGPMSNYVTLSDRDREVEIGGFLSEKERLSLYHDLARIIPAISRAAL